MNCPNCGRGCNLTMAYYIWYIPISGRFHYMFKAPFQGLAARYQEAKTILTQCLRALAYLHNHSCASARWCFSADFFERVRAEKSFVATQLLYFSADVLDGIQPNSPAVDILGAAQLLHLEHLGWFMGTPGCKAFCWWTYPQRTAWDKCVKWDGAYQSLDAWNRSDNGLQKSVKK